MSNSTEAVLSKYYGEIDNISTQLPVDGVIPIETAKIILFEALSEYERMNSTPRVDFWGQPI